MNTNNGRRWTPSEADAFSEGIQDGFELGLAEGIKIGLKRAAMVQQQEPRVIINVAPEDQEAIVNKVATRGAYLLKTIEEGGAY